MTISKLSLQQKSMPWTTLTHVSNLVFSGSVVPCDVWHASPVRSRASEKTGAGRGGAGEEGTVGAPQRPAANQESTSCRTGIQGRASRGPADIWLGVTHGADATPAEGGVFTCLQSITAFSPGHKYIGSTSFTSAGRGGAQGRYQEPDSRLHQEEEQGGDCHLSRLDCLEISQNQKRFNLFFIYIFGKVTIRV